MQIGINDLDDDDLGMEFNPTNPEPPVNDDLNGNLGDLGLNGSGDLNGEDFISDFLKTRGIDDIQKIKFEGEDGNIIERDWKDLSKEEKFNIFNTPLELPNQQDNSLLTNDEVEFLNSLRESGLSVQEYINSIASTEETPKYKVDELSDDEIYLLDLESRVGELSDEEAALALNNAKLNEEFYNKQVEGIRKEYKEREDFLNQQELITLEQQLQQAFEEYKNTIVDSISNFNSIGSFDLNFEDRDREELASFMLSLDENGVNYLYLALLDPETLTKAAWFILNGDEAFNSILDYFTNLIRIVSENSYKKGLEDAAKQKNNPKPEVVIDNSKKNTHRQYNSIEDLDDE